MVISGSMPPPAKMLRQITAAPTKEMASGTKMNVFAITPQRTESASTAMSRPSEIQTEGTSTSHIRLLRIASLNWV